VETFCFILQTGLAVAGAATVTRAVAVFPVPPALLAVTEKSVLLVSAGVGVQVEDVVSPAQPVPVQV
jgi:hypothetical protein